MANYSIVANSTFQPFTYQELMAPVQRMSDVHDLVAAQYDALSTQADILEAMGANEVDKDSKAYGQYKAYSDSLRNEADALNKYGLQLDSKGRMLDMRKRYNKEIDPIKKAWDKRLEEAKTQQDEYNKNPTLMFTRTAAQTSIDDYVANPMGGYGVINGSLITKQMSDMAAQLAEQYREGKISMQDIDPYTRLIIEHGGMTADEINQWMADPSSFPTLTNMMNQVLTANGATPEALQGSRNAADILRQSIGYAQMGAWNAMGKDKTSIQANYGARAALEDYYNAQSQARSHAYAMEQQAAKAAASGSGNGNANSGYSLRAVGLGVDTADGYSVDGLSAVSGLYNADGKTLKQGIFGNTTGEVNPMQVYDDYKKAMNKYAKYKSSSWSNSITGGITSNGSTITNLEEAQRKAKAEVLNKYGKYGISDVLSDEQYNVLKGLGYKSSDSLSSPSFMDDFNNTVQQRIAYDTYMPEGAYNAISGLTRNSLINLEDNDNLSSMVYTYDGFKKGKGVSKVSDIGIDKKQVNDSKDAKMVSLGYDPHHKGFVRVSYSNGKTFLVRPEIIGGMGLKNHLSALETVPQPTVYGTMEMATPDFIASELINYVNGFSKGKSTTSSSGE